MSTVTALSKLNMIPNAAERAFVQAWLDMDDRADEAKMVALAKDVFDIDDDKKAHTRAMTILGRPKVQYAVRLTVERRQMATPVRLGVATDSAIDFLEDTVEQAGDDDAPAWPESKCIKRDIGVKAAKSLLSGFAKVADGSNEKSMLEVLKAALPEGARGLVDMDPADLVRITTEENDG